MRIEELEVVCQEAARNLVQRQSSPVPTAVVLPLPDKTKVTSLGTWPDDDAGRLSVLERFSDEVAKPSRAPCYGFVAEAVAPTEEGPVDVVVVVYGARRHHPRISAAVLQDGELGEFTESEPLEATAMPFLAPLQRTVDAAPAPDAFSG